MSSYWKNKTENSAKARAWTEKMEKTKLAEIESSAGRTMAFGGPNLVPEPTGESKGETAFRVVQADSVTATLAEAERGAEGLAALNFASYKNPGGAFLEGSSAQEESLCHESFLYDVLARQETYYAWNRKNLNRSLYLDRALWSPDVEFERAGTAPVKCAVITCAAPNFRAASRYLGVSRAENAAALRSRIRFLKDVAEATGTKTLVAGAFGCGVFGQDPFETAEIFLDEFGSSGIEDVVFAIPGGRNLEAFLETIEASFGSP